MLTSAKNIYPRKKTFKDSTISLIQVFWNIQPELVFSMYAFVSVKTSPVLFWPYLLKWVGEIMFKVGMKKC